MKPNVLCLISFFLLIGTGCYAQAKTAQKKSDKWHLNIGFGYYNPMAAGAKGNIFYSEVGYKLPTDFIAGIGFGLSDVFEEYDEIDVPLFGGFRSYHNYYLIRVFLSKKFRIGKRNEVLLGTGLLYEQVRFAEPNIYLIPLFDDQGNIDRYELQIGIRKSNTNYIDIGQILHFNYSYRIGKIGLGVRSEVHYLYAIGFGGLIVAPQLSFTF